MRNQVNDEHGGDDYDDHDADDDAAKAAGNLMQTFEK